MPADDVTIMVAETPLGDIVGCWTVGPILVLEGLWVREDYRKKSTLFRLFHGMIGKLKAIGVPLVFSIVQTPEMARLAAHGGFEPIQGQIIMLQLGEQ